MKYAIAFIILACLQIQLQGQSYDLRFEITQNDKIEGGTFAARVQVKKSWGSVFEVGSSNIRFNYNAEALSISHSSGSAEFTPLNFNIGAYNPMTVTGSGDGFYSINIDLTTPGSGSPAIGETAWIDVAEVQFTITDVHQTSKLSFRTESPGNTIMFRDDEATILEQGTFSGLDVPLSKKLKPYFISKQDKNISVYPNPASDFVKIVLPDLERDNKYIITIFDRSGKAVYNISLTGPESILSLGQLKNGLYLIRISDDNGFTTATEVIVMH